MCVYVSVCVCVLYKYRSMQLWLDPVQQQAAVNKVLKELVRALPKHVVMAHKDLFPNWESFLDTFTRVGGVHTHTHTNMSSIHSHAWEV